MTSEPPAAWMQREDGSWWAVDDYGIAWPVQAFRATDGNATELSGDDPTMPDYPRGTR